VHWHGLILPEDMDGHPRFAIEPGQTYVYEFEVINRAGMNWFHPHPDMLTGQQAYAGLAGLFIYRHRSRRSRSQATFRSL
jgi:FtsP/CotA-like multicopper oxidase with cupredoxin domain